MSQDPTNKTVEFIFDVGSPYTYLAFHALPKIAADKDARIVWTPVLLGGIFQATGNRSPVETPAKGKHLEIDLQRWAAHYDVTYTANPHFPINTLMLMRGAVAMQMRSDEALQRYLAAVFTGMFEKPCNMNDPATLGSVLANAGFDPQELLALTQQPEVKARLKSNTESAVERGVFGAPSFFVGDELYWGQDRLNFVETALS
ncbi:2-hydroxychromene-2-carboxylate isomerase [Hydrogenophaga sp. 5NK40-0174]|uniref:2-hydroxychromene-2-carboxylate isomerase n=1 Tax=Hydrogenophaga sp. 5NK40-0174 TaxID=3127649 RepID=UPI0031053D24